MSQNVQLLVKALQRMTVTELRRKYQEAFNEPCRSGNKQHLLRRIAWRIQAQSEGDLPARAARLQNRAKDLADDAQLRLNPPRSHAQPQMPAGSGYVQTVRFTHAIDPRSAIPGDGALITRQYKGRTIVVRVLPSGFDFEGVVYRSLSAIAKEVTGAHWNGRLFFGLTPSRRSQCKEQAA